MKPARILAIETSCDETACAVIENGRALLASTVASQMEMHARFGGVYPEVASRQHVLSIIPVVEQTLVQSNITLKDVGYRGTAPECRCTPLALVYLKKGQNENTIEDETKAIGINPGFSAAYHNRGIAYARKARYDEAIEDYNKALSLKPSFYDAYFSRGVAFMRKASADFKKACDKGNKFACDNLKQISE